MTPVFGNGVWRCAFCHYLLEPDDMIATWPELWRHASGEERHLVHVRCVRPAQVAERLSK